jgi:SAM-dependent methyltransferase
MHLVRSGGEADFLISNLEQLARSGDANRVAITGSADYSMPSYALRAYRRAQSALDLTVVDRCETPLFLTRWYFERQNAQVATDCCDILDYKPAGVFDVVMTHSFLGSFGPGMRNRLFAIWARLLRPGGTLLFINRLRPEIHGEQRFSPEEIETFCRTARDEAAEVEPKLDLHPDAIAIAARAYAEHYVSHPVQTQDQVVEFLKVAGFTVEGVDVSEYDGRSSRPITGPSTIQRANYVRVIATRL